MASVPSDSAAPPATAPSLLNRQRRALRSLQELTEMRGEAEARILDTYEKQKRQVTERHDAAVAAAEADHERDTAALRSKHERLLTQLDETFGGERAKLTATMDGDVESIREKADVNSQKARKGLQEAVWVAEAVYEGTENQPREEFEQQKKVVERNIEEVGKVEDAAAGLLKRYRFGGLVDSVRVNESAVAEVDRDEAAELTGVAQERLQALKKSHAARMFIGIKPVLLFVLPVAAAGAVAMFLNGWRVSQWLWIALGGAVVAMSVILFLLWRSGKTAAERLYTELMTAAAGSRVAGEKSVERADRLRLRAEQYQKDKRDKDIEEAREKYTPIIAEIEQRRDSHLGKIEARRAEIRDKIEANESKQRAEADAEFERRSAEIDATLAAALEAARRKFDERLAGVEATYEEEWTALEERWHAGIDSVSGDITRIDMRLAGLFPAWSDEQCQAWRPPHALAPAIRIGGFQVDRAALPGGLPGDERLKTALPAAFETPAMLEFPERCSLFVQADGEGREAAMRTLELAALRLLTTLPPGKVRLTILDPVGLGQNFAGFMHLADYDGAMILDKIWTETRHIEQRLIDLTEHMENVIQKYLRNEFETIDEYNEQAGEIAEPYRFLIIGDFPVNFSEVAARRLASIINSGARCGVYTLIYHDTRHPLPKGIDQDDLERAAAHLVWQDDRLRWNDAVYEPFALTLDTPPDDAFITTVLQKVGEGATEAGRVEVPFEIITPDPADRWTHSTAQEVSVPMGRAGATKLQSMTLGRGTSQHVLIAGKTGSGKSTLLHAMITNLALRYPPDEVQFYLVDFKKGVEFKAYASHQLPHARVVAIESDREFGLSVLQRIDEELKFRGNRFRELGVQDLPGFREAAPDEPMPRVLLIIDEFQELFVEDDKVAQDCSLLMDRLVRQGRAFGIHVILGSQTLGGAYSLARSTLGQMAVRIALQCSEADAYLIMSDDNAAARLLSRPGEAIYNDSAGMVEGNNPFQVAWLGDDTKATLLSEIHELASDRDALPHEPMIVYEGNVPADYRRNVQLSDALAAAPESMPRAAHVWLGEAIAIKDPTSATLRRHSGGNLLIAGQQDESALAMMTMGMVSLGAQFAPGEARFVVMDGIPPDAPGSGFLGEVTAALPHETTMIEYRAVEETVGELAAEVERRQDSNATDQPAVFIIAHALPRYRMLRPSDDFGFSMDDDSGPMKADKAFQTILRDGPAVGVHTLAWCDTMNNIDRVLGRNGLKEFELRVLFQMSATDSASLIDTPEAGKLGLRRAIFSSEEEGTLEKFRPYALPDAGWLESVRSHLQSRG